MFLPTYDYEWIKYYSQYDHPFSLSKCKWVLPSIPSTYKLRAELIFSSIGTGFWCRFHNKLDISVIASSKNGWLTFKSNQVCAEKSGIEQLEAKFCWIHFIHGTFLYKKECSYCKFSVFLHIGLTTIKGFFKRVKICSDRN